MARQDQNRESLLECSSIGSDCSASRVVAEESLAEHTLRQTKEQSVCTIAPSRAVAEADRVFMKSLGERHPRISLSQSEVINRLSRQLHSMETSAGEKNGSERSDLMRCDSCSAILRTHPVFSCFLNAVSGPPIRRHHFCAGCKAALGSVCPCCSRVVPQDRDLHAEILAAHKNVKQWVDCS